MNSPAQVLSASQRETYWRTLQAFNATRVAIAIVLLLYLKFAGGEGYWIFEQFAFAETGFLYLMLALVALVFAAHVRLQFTLQVIAGIAVDIVVMSLFYVAAGGVRSGLGI